MGLPHIWVSPDIFPSRNWVETECLFGWGFYQGGQRNSLQNMWELWGGGCRAHTDQVFGVHVDNTRCRRCVRPAEHAWPGHIKEIQSILNLMGCLAGTQVKQLSWGFMLLHLERGLRRWESWAGEGWEQAASSSLCGGGIDQHHALNQLKAFWLLYPLWCSKAMLDIIHGVARSC